MEFVPIRMLSPAWARGRARVEHGEIVLDGDRADRYGFERPEESERMAFDLAALSYGDEKAAVSFAGRWGLLWHGADDQRATGRRSNSSNPSEWHGASPSSHACARRPCAGPRTPITMSLGDP